MTQVVSLTKCGRFKIPIMMLAKYGKDRPAKVTIEDLGTGWLVKLIPNDKKLLGKLDGFPVANTRHLRPTRE